MAIGNTGYLVSITYPNGSQVTRGISIYHGPQSIYGVTGFGNLAVIKEYSNIHPYEVIEFDYPTVVGEHLVYNLYFSGSYKGVSLPPMVFDITRESSRVYIKTSMEQVAGDTVFQQSNIYISNDSLPAKIGMIIAPLTPGDPKSYTIALGPQPMNCKYDERWAVRDVYWGFDGNAVTLIGSLDGVDYGYPFGPIDDPEKYESKETDTSEATMTDTSDPIEVDDLPSAVVAGGMFGIYEMTNQQLTWLKNALVDPSFIESLARAVTSPWDYVISLKAIPTVFPAYTTQMHIGNKTITMESNPKLLNGYMKDIDCGSVAIPKFFGTFLDWSPYTSITAYLPFVGYVSLAVDKFIGNHVKLKYRVDVVSGDCVVFVSNDEGLICTYAGNCAYTLPLRANDSNQLFGGLKSALAGIATGNVGQLEAGAMQIAGGIMKPNMVNMSGLSANSGAMGNRKPYLIIERPVIALPKTYGYQKGYRSGISAKLSNLRGFTRVEAIHLDDLAATDAEKADIVATLNTGVILK